MNEQANQAATGGIDIEPMSPAQVPFSEMVAREVAKQIEGSPMVAELKAKLAAAEAERDAAIARADAKQLKDEHAQPGVANESQASSLARWGIILDPAREKNEIDPVFVSVNGRAYNIKRGKYVEVPREVVEVLNHAVQTVMVPRMNDQGQPVGADPHNARRFPYRMLGKAVDEKGQRTLPEGGPSLEHDSLI